MPTPGIAEGSAAAAPAPGALFGAETAVPSTAAQREIFGAAQSDPAASLGYNHSISIFLEGEPDLDALYSAFLNLLNRHEALRGRFSPDGATFIVRERIGFELPLVDLTRLPEAGRAARYERLVHDELDHVFDLLEGPLIRAQVVKRAAGDYVLVFNCHHAVVDGWSLKIILGELPQLYSDLVAGRDATTLPAAASFLRYLGTAVAREREQAEATRAFWRTDFPEGLPVLDLPLDNPRPALRSYESRREDYRVDRSVYERLKAAGAQRGASQFVTLLAAFALYLSRISGQRELVIGVPAAGQITSGESGLLGHDARVMPIRCTLEEGDSFASYAQRVRERFLAAYDHQWITIPELIGALEVEVEKTRAPIAVMFNFDPGMDAPTLGFAGLRARHFFNHRNAETFELAVNAVVEGSDLVLEWAYNRTLFDADEMHARLRQFEFLMAAIVAQPAAPVERLAVVPPAQVEAMDRDLNSTAMAVEHDRCVDQLVARAVLATPDKVAVECGAERLSYWEVWNRAGEIAAALGQEDLGPVPLVGVMLERSAHMIAVLLGVWRAGAAFVPLDPAYPADRLEYMVEHSGMRVLLTGRDVARTIQTPVKTIDVADIPAGTADGASVRPGRKPDDLAYVIYTSGSTGKPKGVQVPHAALVNLLTTMQTRAPGIGPDERVLAVTTLSFDIAELELWLPLVAGATTVIADRATAMDGAALVRLLREARITFMQATPATWRVLLLGAWPGDRNLTALCGGEALPRDLAQELRTRVKALWNVYGPTETTVWSTIDRVSTDLVTIGKPVGNTQAYVLDACQAWVPRGSIGELWLGGSGVTRGYLGRDDLTRERFQPNPFTGRGRMYRTGDLVRLRRDGRIEYLGRNDFQVKVRGYRIELGEVQHALARLPRVRQCVVVVREKDPGDAHLVAFYTASEGEKPSSQELRTGLRASLPEYMVPGWFVELEHLPLTDNGKIDQKALPDPFHAVAPIDPEQLRIEALLGEHPLVAAAALCIPNAADPDSRPVAFIVPRARPEPSAVDLRRYLRERCREGLIPDRVVLVPGLPRTRRHGLDRERLAAFLPALAGDAATQRASELLQTENERLLAQVWRELLGLAHVGRHDNFFDLGGHSLLTVRMVARVARDTGVRLDPRDVLLDSLGKLAARLEQARAPGTVA